MKKTSTPPASLEFESRKAHGSYRELDVVEQLEADFCGKCYLCEMNQLQSIQVEHLLPHKNRKLKERVFDWNNLFYSCTHCNSVKKAAKYDDHILNCCKIDPEDHLEQRMIDGHVHVECKTDDEDSILTADLIENCFELTNTGIRVIECKTKINELNEALDVLYKALSRYKKNPNSARAASSLRGLLKRESKFAGFKRQYVRDHLEDYPALEELISG